MPELLDQLKGALANRYRIERELGVGGMAIVYLAHDLRHNRQVALKVISARYSGDPESRERFRRETEAVARLQHPGIDHLQRPRPPLRAGQEGGSA